MLHQSKSQQETDGIFNLGIRQEVNKKTFYETVSQIEWAALQISQPQGAEAPGGLGAGKGLVSQSWGQTCGEKRASDRGCDFGEWWVARGGSPGGRGGGVKTDFLYFPWARRSQVPGERGGRVMVCKEQVEAVQTHQPTERVGGEGGQIRGHPSTASGVIQMTPTSKEVRMK